MVILVQLRDIDLSHVYLAYTPEAAEEAIRSQSGKGGKTSRPKTASTAKSKNTKRFFELLYLNKQIAL